LKKNNSAINSFFILLIQILKLPNRRNDQTDKKWNYKL